ncbi:cytochrome c oxidase assembly protein subunit 15 [Rhodococcus sp. AG1013]|nr:cytochrome c oxidase assembly protein subunit 15 [Rhodococcus sp. AG1013]
MTPLSWLARRVSFGWGSLRVAATATVVTSVLIIVTGGVVRVTGSGLGCPTWPSCTGEGLAPTPEMGIHGAIEFGNRLLTVVLCVAVGALIIVARCQREPDRAVLRAAWLQFWIIVLNALVGGVTVLARLSPYVVAAHLIAAMLLLTAAVYTFELVERLDRSTATATADPALAVRARWLVAATAVLVVIGTAVTGSGVHAGDSSDVHRMPFDWTTMVIIHAVAAVVTFAVAVSSLLIARRSGADSVAARASVFIALLLAQGFVGVLQFVGVAAEALVVVHMLGAALIWAGALRVLFATDPGLGGSRAAFHASVAETSRI